MSETNRPIKFSARLPLKLNEKLDKESQETGLSKNSVLVMALNHYFEQREALLTMADMNELLKKLSVAQVNSEDLSSGRRDGSNKD